MKRILYIFILLAALSCSKDDGPSGAGEVLGFSVITPDMADTKAEVTSGGLQGGTDKVYVYGLSSDGSNSAPVFDAPGVSQLSYNGTTGIWTPKQEKLWDTSGKTYYRFYGYACSSNANSDGNALSITSDTYGRQFTVTQPASATWEAPDAIGESADGSGTVDYLLSYLVDVAPATNYPLVPLKLEHAMARVDVDVQIANAMFTKDENDAITDCLVKNVQVQVSGIKNSATMLCLQPKPESEEGTNTWSVTLGTSVATYKVTDIHTGGFNLSGAEDAISPDMSFIAVPVTNAQMTDYILTLTYDNRSTAADPSAEDYVPEYEYEFALKDFSPNGWVSGHKVKYVLTIDNSIHLTGKIVDYEDVDYIEAVIVPDIAEKGNEQTE